MGETSRFRCVHRSCDKTFDDPDTARQHEQENDFHWITDITFQTTQLQSKMVDAGSMTESTDNAHTESERDQQFNPSKEDGVYYLHFTWKSGKYIVGSGPGEETTVSTIKINGKHIGTLESFDTECDDFEIEDGTLHLQYDE